MRMLVVAATCLRSQNAAGIAGAAGTRRLDIFGILVLSFVTGNFGGITRDLLIGAVPPAALADGRYLLVSVLAGLISSERSIMMKSLGGEALLGIARQSAPHYETGVALESPPDRPTIAESASSRGVDEIRKSPNPAAPGDVTLSNCMSST
jgi:hypothetical protein